jgi:hypothetical protein
MTSPIPPLPVSEPSAPPPLPPPAWPGILLGVVAAVFSLASLAGHMTGPPYGAATVTLFGMAGLAVTGAVLVFRGVPAWRPLLGVWAAVQIPVLILDPSGALTQQFLHLGITWTQTTAVNGQLTGASGFGINLVGLAWLGWWFYVVRRRAHPPFRQPEHTSGAGFATG